ncbi:MAG: ureidoglycolate lyase [Pelagibacterales bacterium]|nr:ureidoglycolate lyase [Pelagibacterales bacterium]
MKLLRVGDRGKEKPAIIDLNGKIRDLTSLINDFTPENINEDLIKKIQNTNLQNLPEFDRNIRVGSCIEKPQKFIGIGLNYTDHAEEQNLKAPEEPIIFFKSPSCIIGPYDNIIIPKNSKKTDWEVELGFVILKKASYINESESLSHVLGFFLVNDVSEREWQKEKCGQWVKGKSADTFGPIGPYIVTPDELIDYQSLDMSLDVNGVRMQTGNTKKMIFNVKFIISYLSNFMTLMPGDIITTGTPPGVGENKHPPVFLKNGDEVSLKINKLGKQKHKVIAM